MTIYTAEINGRGIAAFESTWWPPKTGAHGTVFQEDLFRLETHAAPLWDGVAEIYVRPALREEEAKWQASWARALLRGDVEEGEASWVAFLVPVVDPTGELSSDNGQAQSASLLAFR